MSDAWRLFRGDGASRRVAFPPPPPWRKLEEAADHRGRTYRPTDSEVEMVNVALYLRRPLLVEGPPGSGKSSLAFAVAKELELGPVLHWPINSRTVLRDGLYRYDAVGRMHKLGLRAGTAPAEPAVEADIGSYLTLGPLGTALLPADRPRVLLIDEIDKSDIDLPNDLLHVLENGAFGIPELERVAATNSVVEVLADPGEGGSVVKTTITNGRVQATTFPFIVITSNGERELPPAFLRRCVRYAMQDPDERRLRAIVEAHLGPVADGDQVAAAIRKFLARLQGGEELAIDQLLNAVYLLTGERRPSDEDWGRIADAVLRDLRAL
jgi:MoxR-like ATPase